MGNLLAYSGIVTKVRAMQAKLLTDEDFQNIAAFHTVTEVAAYLKEHPGYRNVLADMDENRLHRGEIEKLLVQSLYSDYTRLYRFSGMDQKKFLELYLKRYEMNLINYCLRIVFNHYQKDDTCVSLQKQYKMMEIILYLYKRCRELVAMNMPMSVLKEENIFERVIAIKYDVPNDNLQLLDQYLADIDAFHDRIMEKNA